MKLVIVLTIFVLAFEKSIANPTVIAKEDLNDIDVKDIVSDALKLIVKELNVTIDLADELNDVYATNSTAALEEIDRILLKAVDKAYNITIDIVDKILDQLDNDLNAAGQKGIKCIRAQKDNLNQVIDEVVTELTKCLAFELPSIIAPSRGLLAVAKKTRDTLSVAQTNLENCKLGAACLLQLPKDLQDLPAELASDLKAALPVLKEIGKIIVQDVPPCVKSEITSLKPKLISIIDNTMDCIVKS